AFLQDQVVQQLQWLTPQAFLDGLALGRLTPGPIPMLAAFIGYHVGGLGGAVVAGGGVFFPSVVLVVRLLPLLEALPPVGWVHAGPPGHEPRHHRYDYRRLAEGAAHRGRGARPRGAGAGDRGRHGDMARGSRPADGRGRDSRSSWHALGGWVNRNAVLTQRRR